MNRDELAYLSGKRVLVTGGTGSFGRTFVELCLENPEVREVIVYSRDEQKHVAMQRLHDDSRIKHMIGDVRDLSRLRLALRGVDFVLNAAAVKHVHFTEEHPMEAVATNTIGANNVVLASMDAGVKCLVTISTDKAVAPVNVMGMSKALQERIVSSYAGSDMRIGVVRYGNVLASNGSVVPFFKTLIERGENTLPVTDRRMTRFVLTLEESVQLVVHALQHCDNGETFVLDSPAFGISDVAEVVAEYASSKNRKVSVKEIGIRPGEKLHETLITSEEMRRTTKMDRLWMVRKYESAHELFAPSQEERSLSSDSVSQLSKPEILDLLQANDCLPSI